ncbi:putative sodium-dependent multivitamin transporter [Amphiura filiformis]|uniref:putative sodium-dependent multivitamin transporter n=1 Tax=Amphiura filiformis TaxID=82378 RepID=UPI003B21BA6F
MFLVIFGTMISVLSMGCIEAGGFTYVWEFNIQEDRINVFYFPKDLTARMSFVSCVMGGFINSLAQWAVSQTSVQRILAARTIKDAQVSVWLNLPFTTFLKFLSCFLGLVMYTFYYGGVIATQSPMTTNNALDSDVRTPPNYTSPDQVMSDSQSPMQSEIARHMNAFA